MTGPVLSDGEWRKTATGRVTHLWLDNLRVLYPAGATVSRCGAYEAFASLLTPYPDVRRCPKCERKAGRL